MWPSSVVSGATSNNFVLHATEPVVVGTGLGTEDKDWFLGFREWSSVAELARASPSESVIARSRGPWLDPSRDGLGDFLKNPSVSVGVRERRQADIRAALRIAARLGGLPRHAMHDLADLDAAVDELRAGRLDVLDDQQQALQRPRTGRPELDRCR